MGRQAEAEGEVSLTSGFLSAVSATRGREGGDTLDSGKRGRGEKRCNSGLVQAQMQLGGEVTRVPIWRF